MKQGNNRLAKNMSSYALLQIVNLLVGIVLPRLYLKVYGSEINGVVSTINSFITYFSYLEAGLGLTLIHALFKPLAEDNKKETSKILSFSNKQYKNISYVYLVLVVLLSLLFPLFGGTDRLSTTDFIFLVFVIGLYGALDFYTMAKYRVLLTADRKEYVISYAMIAAQLLRFALVWGALQFEGISIVVVKIMPILTLIFRSVILKIYVRRKYPEISFSEKYKKNIVKTGERWDALMLQISISTGISLPTIIVSQVQSYEKASVFAVYNMVVSAMIAVVSALSSGVSPMLGKSLVSGGNVRWIYNIYEWVVAVALSVIFSVGAIMLLPFVKLYSNVANDVNYINSNYAILFVLWGAIYTFRMPATALINASAVFRENRMNNIVNLVFQIVGGIVMTIFFGVVGLLISMILSSFMRNVWMSITMDKKLLRNTTIRAVWRQLLMAAIISVSFFVGQKIIGIDGITISSWILYAIATTAIEIVFCIFIFAVTNLKTLKAVWELFWGKFEKLKR